MKGDYLEQYKANVWSTMFGEVLHCKFMFARMLLRNEAENLQIGKLVVGNENCLPYANFSYGLWSMQSRYFDAQIEVIDFLGGEIYEPNTVCLSPRIQTIDANVDYRIWI